MHSPIEDQAHISAQWKKDAVIRYERCIRDTLNWMLKRSPLGDGLLNTKVNPLTGADYDQQSGIRGPDFTYGWIQGRGLEALVTFANYYRETEPTFAMRLDQAALKVYKILDALLARDGHAYFLYDSTMQAIRQGPDRIEPQQPAGPIYSYSDAFVAKGLFAASCVFEPSRSTEHLAYLLNVVAAIEEGRFQMDETVQLSSENVEKEPDDFGSRMILLGAAGLLHRTDYSAETDFADRFIKFVLDRYYDSHSGLLLNVSGQDLCNAGHAIEFCGFALEHLHNHQHDSRIEKLVSILVRSLQAGLQGPGIALSLSARSGKAESPYYPWWSMPEAIRACALAFRISGDTQLAALWKQADNAFFTNYWQPTKGFAFQTRTVDGPVDFVPSTPDLDPGYHTGLSLLTAIKAMDAG